MKGSDFLRVVKKYKHCPNCGASYKSTDMECFMENEVITISCKCGWSKKVDKDNKEVVIK